MGQLTVTFIRDERPVLATIQDEHWQTQDATLKSLLEDIYLPVGHHGDRDLEVATKAAQLLGGVVCDNREEPTNLDRMPQ